jgi:hypothetical protein
MRACSILLALFGAMSFCACNTDEHKLRIENQTDDVLFVFGVAKETELTNGYAFVDPQSTKTANLGDNDPARIYVIWDHPRNADGTPGRFMPGQRQFSCTWDEAKVGESLIVTDGDPPCGVLNVSPP